MSLQFPSSHSSTTFPFLNLTEADTGPVDKALCAYERMAGLIKPRASASAFHSNKLFFDPSGTKDLVKNLLKVISSISAWSGKNN